MTDSIGLPHSTPASPSKPTKHIRKLRLLAHPETNNYEFSSMPLNPSDLRGAVIMSCFVTAAIINCPKRDKPGGSGAQGPDLLMEALCSHHTTTELTFPLWVRDHDRQHLRSG